MKTSKAITILRDMQAQIIHGKNTMGEIADLIENLNKLAEKQHTMLRAFRHSMDTNKPFPSQEKLDEIIAEMNSQP